VISLNGEAINFADLFSGYDGLHELDDKEEGTRRSIGFKTILDFRSQISEFSSKNGIFSGREGDPVPAAGLALPEVE